MSRSLRTENSRDDRLRADLFLKRSKLVKRRTLASTLCENGWVLLNGKEVQAGKSVRVGDRLQIRYSRELLTVEVLRLPRAGLFDENCYRVLSTSRTADDLI